MSGFIPMVSTTPPPMDDDDFGDFMDGTHDDHDDIEEISSPVNYDDYSYPSLNSPPDTTHSMGFSSEGEESPTKNRRFGNEELKSNDKEVETILAEQTEVEMSIEKKSSDISNGYQVSNGASIHSSAMETPSQLSSKNEVEDDWMNFEDSSSHIEYKTNENSIQDNVSSPSGVICNGSPEPDSLDSDDGVKSDEESIGEDKPDLGKVEVQTENITQQIEPVEPSTLSEAEVNVVRQVEDDNPDNGTVSADDKLPRSEAIDQYDDFVEARPNIEVKSGDLSAPISDDSSVNPEENSSPSQTEEFEAEFDDFSEISEKNTTSHEFKTEDASNLSTKPDFLQQSPANINHKSLPRNNSINNEGEANEFSAFESEPPQENKDFTDFQTVSKTDSENSDFDDFNDFSSNRQTQNTQVNSNNGDESTQDAQQVPNFECDFGAFESEIKDSDDGFADFSNAAQDQSRTAIETSQDDFGAFSSTKDDDDDFTDFSSGSASTWNAFSTTVTKKLNLTEKVANYISKYSTNTDDADGSLDDRISHLDEHLTSDDTLSKDVETPSTASVESMGIVWPGELWDQLEDIDNAIALNFLWNGSGHNKKLLRALGMHTQNILFSGAKQAYYVPTYYAAGLGLIDPSKGILKPMSAAEKITAMSPTDKNPPASLDDAISEEPHSEWKTIADEHGTRHGMAVDDSWLRSDQNLNKHPVSRNDSSHDSISIASSNLDLNFFDNHPTSGDVSKHSGNSSDLIDPELLELTSAPTTEPPPPPKDSGSATLSKILASIKGDNNSSTTTALSLNLPQDNSKWEEEESKLSEESRSVLKRLPDLSYMRAKVLMFPMNMSRVKIGED